jgi:hypothetical protein
MIEINKNKICFVTAITGNYESTCKKPIEQTIGCDFKVFTDNPNIQTHGIWDIVDISKYYNGIDNNDINSNYINSMVNNKHTFNRAKFIKLNLYRIPELIDYDIVIWLDGTVQISNNRCAELIFNKIESGKNIIVYEHEYRSGNLKQEVIASNFNRYTSTNWNGQDQPYQDVNKQYEDYINEGFKEDWIKDYISENTGSVSNNVGVWITCFVAFDMRKEETHRFLNEWWMQNLTKTTQDQIGFPYVCWKMKIIPYTLPDFEIGGSTPHYKTDLYIKHNHGI